MLAVANNLEDVLHKMFGFWDSERWWFFVGAVCTVAIVTYIFKDNVLFRIAEHVMIGLAAGYTIVVTFYTVGAPEVIIPLFVKGNFILIIPSLLGLMLAVRVFPKLSWISRFPLAILVGSGVGQALPRVLQAQVFQHISSSAKIDFVGLASMGTFYGWSQFFGSVILVVGTICGLMYFFFSKPHTGLIGGSAKIGVIVLMIGFGASFGYTVQARITLFADRVLYLLRDWLDIL